MTDTPAPAPMTTLESAIRDLASGYEAFWTCKMTPVERRAESDWSALLTWISHLEAAQDYLGIQMVPRDVLAANRTECEKNIKLEMPI